MRPLVGSGDGLDSGRAQPIGAQQRRAHSEHLTVKLNNCPHTDLFTQKGRYVVSVGINKQADLIGELNAPTVLDDVRLDLRLDEDPVRQVRGLNRRRLLVRERHECPQSLDKFLGMGRAGMLALQSVPDHPDPSSLV
jgi:hypothetical protein